MRFDLNLADIAEVWRRGSVVSLVAARPDRDGAGRGSGARAVLPGSCRIRARAAGRCMAAIEEAVPADVLTAALYTRFRSRQEHTFAEKVLSAMRTSSAATLTVWWVKGFYKAEDDALFAAIKKFEAKNKKHQDRPVAVPDPGHDPEDGGRARLGQRRPTWPTPTSTTSRSPPSGPTTASSRTSPASSTRCAPSSSRRRCRPPSC